MVMFGAVVQHAGGDEQDERGKRDPQGGEKNARSQITAASTTKTRTKTRRTDYGTSKTNGH